MKFKTTRKQIQNGYGLKFLFQTGYCDLQYLLWYEQPTAYTTGIYGWNFDLYDVEGVGITTGYRSMCGKDIPSDLERTYEQLAKKNIESYSSDRKKTFEQKKELNKKLLRRFIKELYRQEKK